MCLIIQKMKNKEIPYEKIKTAWKSNKDGAGICYRIGKKVRIEKGFMSLAGFTEFLKSNEKTFKKKEIIIHLRFTTSGGKSQAMCHPFPVSKRNNDLKLLQVTTDQALVHNGVMFNPILGEYSDTAIFTRWYERSKPDHVTIEKVLGDDRLVIFDHTGTKKLGKWHEIDGNYYSNLYSLSTYDYYGYDDHYFESKYGKYSKFRDDELASIDYDDYAEEFCPFCQSPDIAEIKSKDKTRSDAYCYGCNNIFDITDLLDSDDINNLMGIEKKYTSEYDRAFQSSYAKYGSI